MMRMVNATRFDHEKKTLFVVIQYPDRRFSHLRQRRLARTVTATVNLELHMGFVEQPKQSGSYFGIYGVKTGLLNDIVTCRIACSPFRGKITTICSVALHCTARPCRVARRLISEIG